MKDHMSREQYIQKHTLHSQRLRVWNALYRAVSNMFTDQPFGSFPIRENTAKQKDGLTSFLMWSVLQAKIFQYGFLEKHKLLLILNVVK